MFTSDIKLLLMAKVAVSNNIFSCRRYFNVLFRNIHYAVKSGKTSNTKSEATVAGTPAYTKTDNEYAFGKKYTIKKLEKLLGIRTFTAINIVEQYKKLSLVNGKVLSDNFEMCVGAGLTKSTIMKYPEILSQKDLNMKIDLLRDLPVKINNRACLLLLNYKTLSNFIEHYKKEYNEKYKSGRIEILSEVLEMSTEEVCEALCKKSFLRTIHLDRIRNNKNVLLEYGITISEIKKDLWVLQYSTDQIKHRLDMARKINIGKIKTWMVRCKLEIFEVYVRRRTDNKQILGNSSLAEYLSERLNCSVDEAKVLMIKQPALKNKSMKKMKEILDFLFAKGFQPHQICRVPKIFLHSFETMKKRLKELEPYGRHLDSLYMLTKSKKQYTQFLETLEKGSKKLKSTN